MMKKLAVVCIGSLISVLILAQVTNKKYHPDFKKLEWLVGEWSMMNMKAGTSGTENWVRRSDTELEGWSITLRGADTVAKEKLKLLAKGNDIFYVADVAENKGTVYFKLTSIADGEFTCENPEHDFPKKISYKKEGDHIRATISGNGKSRDFFFVRKP